MTHLDMRIYVFILLGVCSTDVVNSKENYHEHSGSYNQAEGVQAKKENDLVYQPKYIDLTNELMPPVNVHGKRDETNDRPNIVSAQPQDGNVHKNRWKRQVQPLITGISPVSGQQIGGFLTFFGENFESIGSNYSIMIGSTPCICIDAIKNSYFNGTGCRDNTSMACFYGNASDTINQARQVIVTTGSSTTVSIDGGQPFNYTFLENAKIADVQPRKTIPSGGTRITVTGENLRNGNTLTIVLNTEFTGKAYQSPQRTRCDILNDTVALCITPRPALPGSYQNRRKRDIFEAGICQNDLIVEIYISITAGNILRPYPGKTRMCFTKEPELERIKDSEIRFLRYEGQTEIKIYGHRLDYGISKDDYKIYVGQTPCNITSLVSNAISFEPPLTKPEDLGEFQRNGFPLLRVFAGENLPLAPGYIDYLDTEPKDLTPIIGGVIGGILGLLLIVGVLVYCWRRPKTDESKRSLGGGDEDYQRLIQREERSMLDLMDKELRLRIEDCKLGANCLKREQEIGSGHYGKVFLGKLSVKKGETVKEKPVAIKTIKDSGVTVNQLKEFLEEATLMKDLKHKNIVNLLGVVIENNKPYVVLPFMEKGDLKSYVSDGNNKFKVVDLIRLCIQVADGMTHISEQKVVHRDLRAVNCLVSAKIVVKVADFGLSRDIYQGDYYTVQDQQRPLPIKWMAVETLEGHPFSTRSDVWSYGVLMWEVFTRGLKPYADVANNYDILRQYFRNGRRLERPQFCTHDVYAVMMSCWERDPHKRRTFRQLSEVLNDLIGNAPPPPPQGSPDVEKDDKDEDDGYFKPRSSTNEYIRSPGVINDYLTLLAEEGHPEENPEAWQSKMEEKEKQAKTNADAVHYENDGVDKDGYLKPASKYENVKDDNEMMVPSLDEALSIEGQKEAANSGGGTPYFANPPISDSYMSPEGVEKFMFSANAPRGELYQTRNPEYENTNEEKTNSVSANGKKGEKEAQYENALDAKETLSTSDIELDEGEEDEEKETSYENVKEDIKDTEEHYANKQMAKVAAKNVTQQPPNEDTVELDVKSLASKFGGQVKTKDYVNQPGHLKRKKDT